MDLASTEMWSDEIDEILAGDLTVAVGMPTARGGVALASVTPMGLRNREEATVSFTTSLGFGRKLERIAADPRIAVAYHTRQHGLTDRPGLVVVQGTARIRAELSEDERSYMLTQVTRHLGPLAEGWFWDRWLSVYSTDRVLVVVAIRRILWWRDGDTSAAPTVIGEPLGSTSAGCHTSARDVVTPRVSMRKVLRGLQYPHRLLGVLLEDGMPLVVPTEPAGRDATGVVLQVPSPLVPDGDRRAGVLAHDFQPQLVGLATATHTGWLRGDGTHRIWTPHTRHAFAAPANKTLLLLANGAAARLGYRRAIRQGRHEILEHARRD